MIIRYGLLLSARFSSSVAVSASREKRVGLIFGLKIFSRVACSLSILMLLAACVGNSSPETTTENQPFSSVTDKHSDLGIEVIAMRRTAGGNMLDFRFRVLSVDKSMLFFREDIYPYLIDQNSGVSLKVTDTTKVGPMRPTSRDPRVGKVYYMFFRNPNRFIQAGQKVTIVVGDHKIKDLEVE